MAIEGCERKRNISERHKMTQNERNIRDTLEEQKKNRKCVWHVAYVYMYGDETGNSVCGNMIE